MSIIGDIAYNPSTTQANPLTGDSRNFVDKKVNGVMFMNFPVIDIMSMSHKHLSINNHQKSGKDEGTLVIAHTEAVPFNTEDLGLYAASGKLDTDTWKIVKQIKDPQGQHKLQDIHVTDEDIWEHKNTGDSYYILEEPYEGVNFASMSRIRKDYLMDSEQPINNSSISGKKEGAMVVAFDREHKHSALYVASGSNPTDPWVRLVSLKKDQDTSGQHDTQLPATIEPVNNYHPKPQAVTGDCYSQIKDKQYVYLHAMPVYDYEAFEDKNSPENTHELSGKSLGSMVVLTRVNHHSSTGAQMVHKSLYMSTGKKGDDKWHRILKLVEDQNSDPNNATKLPDDITPTGKGDS